MNPVIKRISFGAFLLFALPACRYIDEDMASCAKEFELEYEMRLVTNMTTELETKLSIETDVAVAEISSGNSFTFALIPTPITM